MLFGKWDFLILVYWPTDHSDFSLTVNIYPNPSTERFILYTSPLISVGREFTGLLINLTFSESWTRPLAFVLLKGWATLQTEHIRGVQLLLLFQRLVILIRNDYFGSCGPCLNKKYGPNMNASNTVRYCTVPAALHWWRSESSFSSWLAKFRTTSAKPGTLPVVMA